MTPRAKELLGELLEELSKKEAAPSWAWVPWRAWARSMAHARKVAAREGIRLTKIGRDLYGHRADLDALAARNAITEAAAPKLGSEPEDVDEEVARAFRAA